MGDWTTVDVNGGGMRCYVGVPDGGERAPAMAVLHGGFGFDHVTELSIDRLAAEGIAAIAPDLFHRGVPERPEGGGPRSASMRAADFVADVNAALAHMAGLPAIAGERLGVMGFCMGGQVTYLTAGNNPDLKAAIAFYPGFLFNRLASGNDPAPFEASSSIRCPILVLTGADDLNPSPEQASLIDAELTKHGVVHEMHLYPGAAHAFMSDDSESYREAAATDAWTQCLKWLRRYL
jgi:carboxymethylenebutenolidase